MSVLENFKNIPRSPYGGRQGSNVIFFFFKFATKSLKKKRGGLSPPHGRQAPVAHPSGGPAYRRQGGRSPIPRVTGGLSLPPPSAGDRVRPPLYKASLLVPSSFDLKKSTKNPEKREG